MIVRNLKVLETPAEHLAYFILETVALLDLSAIRADYERERRGFPSHDPRMMTALLLYAYCMGVPSSRKIEQRTLNTLCTNAVLPLV